MKKKAEPKKSNAGRKPLYESKKVKDHLEWITHEVMMGKTEVSLWKSFGVSVQTWENWKNDPKKPEFIEAIKAGRELQKNTVESKLMKKILGYQLEEVEELQDDSGRVVQRKVKTKEHAPDTTSIIFWLKNKDPENWKDRTEVNNTGGFEFNVKLEDDDE